MKNTRLATLALLLLISTFPTLAQIEADSLVAANHLNSAKRHLKNFHRDSFQFDNEQFFQITKHLDLLNFWWKGQATLAYQIAANQPFEALEFLETARQKSWKTQFDRSEWEGYISSLLSSGYIAHNNIQNFEMVKDIYEEAYWLFQKHLGEDSYRIGKYLYFQLGNVYSRLGEFKKAELLLLRDLNFWKEKNELGNARFSDLAIVYSNLGDRKKALKVLEEGLKNSPKPILTGYLLLEKATLQILEKQYPQAEATVQAIKKILSKVEAGDPRLYDLKSGYHSLQAQIFSKNKNYKSAQSSFESAIAVEVQSHNTEHTRDVAKLRNRYAYFLTERADYLQALQQFQKNLTAVLPDFKPTDDHQNPDPKTFKAENTIFEALEGKAKVFEKTGELEAALQCYEVIPQVEERLRQTYVYESSALLSLEESRKRFEQAVEIAWQLFEKTGRQDFAQRAFDLTEQARGVLLLKSLTKAKADLENLLPAADLQKLRELRAKTAWYELQIAEKREEKAEAKTIAQLESELFNLKQQQTIFETQLRKDHPNWAQISEKIEFVQAQNAKNLLRDGQVMLSYFFSDSTVFIFKITKNGQLGWRRAPLPAAFRARSHAFADYLTRADSQNEGIQRFFRTSTELAALLLAPELATLADAKSLVIIPDDVLVFIPFEILILDSHEPSEALGWHHFEYLIKRFSINYTYSATLLRMQQDLTKNRKPAAKYWAGFAPSYRQRPDSEMEKIFAERVRGGGKMYDLRGTHVEVEKIQKMVGGEAFDGEAASESDFKKVANQFQILHFAMHGMANEDAPELSRLLFGDRLENPSGDDNVLYANELQIMQLQAGLAVLSACHTGFGRMRRGEGVYSLARAFASAGVPATVMSLWRLPDNTAPVLMENFYRHLAAGLPKDEALRLAKTDFLATDSLFYFNHPYFWAGITSNGDPSPMPASSGAKWFWWLGGLLLIAAAAFFAFRKFGKSRGAAL